MLRFLLESSMVLSANFLIHSNLANPFTVIAHENDYLISICLSPVRKRQKIPFVITGKILEFLDTEVQKRNMKADVQCVLESLKVHDTDDRRNRIGADQQWLILQGFSDRDVLLDLLIEIAKKGGVDNLPEAMRESLADTRIGPKARLWLFKSKIGEI